VKSRVAKRNVAFKIKDVLELAKWSLSQVTPEQWAGCVRHAIKEEDRYAEVFSKQELKSLQFSSVFICWHLNRFFFKFHF
jgi:hypothetical protein